MQIVLVRMRANGSPSSASSAEPERAEGIIRAARARTEIRAQINSNNNDDEGIVMILMRIMIVGLKRFG